MKVTSLDEQTIDDIGKAFGYYHYAEEENRMLVTVQDRLKHLLLRP